MTIEEKIFVTSNTSNKKDKKAHDARDTTSASIVDLWTINANKRRKITLTPSSAGTTAAACDANASP